MKYFLLSAFLLLSLSVYCQESPAVQQPEAAVIASTGAINGEEPAIASATPEEASPVIAASEEKEPSLEEFLKYQEELWLKEKREIEAAKARKAANLPPPSVLKESEPAALASLEAEEKPVKKTALKKTGTDKVAAGNKQKVVKPAAAETEINIISDENSPAAQEEQQHNNWRGFFMGCIFGLLLGVGVWLLSKYQ